VTAPSLAMLHLPLDTRSLHAFAAAHGLADDLVRGDGGYTIHALFAALFGAVGPKPFSVRTDATGAMSVLAYASERLDTLRTTAGMAAEPQVLAAVGWDGAKDKAMPTDFPVGLRLGFEVRVCPVVRIARGGRLFPAGSEVDVFDHAAEAARRDGADPPERGAAYLGWLVGQMPGVTLASARVAGYRRTRLARRGASGPGGARPLTTLDGRPDVTVQGTLTVDDPAAFAGLLARGVGRHRAFGFGMLLLRPAGRD
jgi:CRISPR system Cascade subunit CasE